MSKLIERIKRISDNANAPIGFKKHVEGTDNASILLLVDITDNILKKAKEIVPGAADAAVLQAARLEPAAISKHARSVQDIPLGLFLGGEHTMELITALSDVLDFVLFDLNTDIKILAGDGPGRVLMLNKTLSPTQMKAINDLDISIDLIYLHNAKAQIDLELLLTCHLVADVLNKPIAINAARKVSANELTHLLNAGVRALILPADISAQEITDLKAAIAALPRTPRKRKASANPLIPMLGSMESRDEVEEDGDVEEDE
jgi:hypothetical protein